MTANSPYWCTESLAVTVDGPAGRSTIAINKPFARIGSHAKSEVVLQGDKIDARCLYLHATPEGIFVVRLLPTQRTTVGSGSWLKPDERLEIGPYHISARLQSGRTPPPPPAALTAWGSATPPLPVCEVFSGGKIRDKRRFRARLNLVGRRRELALQMQGQQVSSCHCALFWDSGRLWCIDLLSSNGTLFQDQPIDCTLLQMGQSLQIGEFSLLLKRLSRSTVRQSAWRTGESDEDVLADDVAHSDALPPKPAATETLTIASGDTGESSPQLASDPLITTPIAEVTQARELLVRAHAELREDQELLQRELAQRSQQLLVQRQQIDQQWQQATQEVASQVSHLQSESALLAAQREEVARLRAEWEEQRRILSAELQSLKQELVQQQAPLDLPVRSSSGAAAAGPAPPSDLIKREQVEDEQAEQEELSSAPLLSAAEVPILELTRQHPPRSPQAAAASTSTVIEASFVVEKENPQIDFAARRAAFVSTRSPHRMPPPVGRRHASELPPAGQSLASAASESDAQLLASSGSDHQDGQGLVVVESSGAATAIKLDEAASGRVVGRRKPAEDDRMGAFVTDRLVLREETRRFWLRVLWGVSAAASLLALAILGYVVLTAAR